MIFLSLFLCGTGMWRQEEKLGNALYKELNRKGQSKWNQILCLTNFLESPHPTWTHVHTQKNYVFSTQIHAIHLGCVGGKILQSISKKKKCLITSCQRGFEFPYCKYAACKRAQGLFWPPWSRSMETTYDVRVETEGNPTTTQVRFWPSKQIRFCC